jgi:hypothetical protein
MYRRFLIYATHIPPGVNLLHFRCVPMRSYAMAVTLKNEEYPEDLLYDMYDPYNYYRSQKLMGENILSQVVKIIKQLMKKTRNTVF